MKYAIIFTIVLAGCGYNDITPDMYETAVKKCAALGGLDSFIVYEKTVYAKCKDKSTVSWNIK